MIDVYMIRHAQSDGNVRSGIIDGRSNYLGITDYGCAQAFALRGHLPEFNAIFSSPSQRTLKTAEWVHGSLDRIIQVDEIQELDQGNWEGRLRKQVHTQDMLAMMNKDPWNFAAPGGESQRHVEERMLGWLDREIIPRGPGKYCVHTHGMSIKCTLRGILGFDPRITRLIDIDNTSVTKISYDGKWEVMAINDTAHLDVLMAQNL